MPRKAKTVNPELEEVSVEAKKKVQEFFALCREIFFCQLENVNKLPADSPFLSTAKEIAKEFEMDWDNLTPEDSNELWLALQEEYYNRIQVDKKYSYFVSVDVREKEEKKAS